MSQDYYGIHHRGSSHRITIVLQDAISCVGCRDVLMWPGAYNPQLPTFTSTIEDDQNGGEYRARLKNDLQARLSALLETFCPNLNCVQAACPMHSVCCKKLQ